MTYYFILLAYQPNIFFSILPELHNCYDISVAFMWNHIANDLFRKWI